MKWICLLLSVMLLSLANNSEAGVDELEDIGPDSSVVDIRVIDGVTVTISTTPPALKMHACTYNDSTPFAFNGLDRIDNAPLNPDNVSATRFISSVQAGGWRFQDAQPIVFEFDQPVTSFGLTTLDLLENEEAVTTMLKLVAYNNYGAPVDSLVRTGRHGPSGLDLDWSVSGEDIVKVLLTGEIAGVDVGGYGIDDLVLTPAVPTLSTLGILVLVVVLLSFACAVLLRRPRASTR